MRQIYNASDILMHVCVMHVAVCIHICIRKHMRARIRAFVSQASVAGAVGANSAVAHQRIQLCVYVDMYLRAYTRQFRTQVWQALVGANSAVDTHHLAIITAFRESRGKAGGEAVKEPCFPAKETDISVKMPHLPAKEPSLLAQEPYEGAEDAGGGGGGGGEEGGAAQRRQERWYDPM